MTPKLARCSMLARSASCASFFPRRRVVLPMRPVLLVLVALALSGCTLPQVRTVADVNDDQPVLNGAGRVASFAGVPTLRIVVLDVGQGDAVLVTAPNGHSFLYDAGPGVHGVATLDALKVLGVSKLDSIVVSHAHEDHYGGVSG